MGSLRQKDVHAATEVLSKALEELASRLGSNEHPELGLLWLEYGDILLQLEEAALCCHLLPDIVEEASCRPHGAKVPRHTSDPSTAESLSACLLSTGQSKQLWQSRSAAVPQDNQDAHSEEDLDDAASESEDDLLLAYESLELAKRCLKLQPLTPTTKRARARAHSRLADFELLQDHPVEAVSECQAAWALLRQASSAHSRTNSPEVASEGICPEIEEVLNKLLRSLERSRQRMDALIEDKDELHILKQHLLQKKSTHGHDERATVSSEMELCSSSSGFSGGLESNDKPITEVQVRSRKRPRDATHASTS